MSQYPLAIFASSVDALSVGQLGGTYTNNASYGHAALHKSTIAEIQAIQNLLGTNSSQTTPTGANRIPNSTSGTAFTWTATPTITGLTTTAGITVGTTLSVTGAATFSSTVALNGVSTVANNIALTFAANGATAHTITNNTSNDLHVKIGTAGKSIYYENSAGVNVATLDTNNTMFATLEGYYLATYSTGSKYYKIHHDNVNVVHEVNSTTSNHYWNDAGGANRMRLGLATGGDSIFRIFKDDGVAYGGIRYNSSSDLFEFESGTKTIRLNSGSGVIYHAGTMFPNANNTYDYGSVATHGRDFFGQNAYTTVSDRDKKRDIVALAEEQVLALGRGFETVSYLWKDEVIQESYTKNEEVVVVDTTGEMRKEMCSVQKVRDVELVHHRRHAGFLAQQVKEQLDLAGISTEDFAAYVEDEDGNKAMRYGELIPYLWKYVQILDGQLQELRGK